MWLEPPPGADALEAFLLLGQQRTFPGDDPGDPRAPVVPPPDGNHQGLSQGAATAPTAVLTGLLISRHSSGAERTPPGPGCTRRRGGFNSHEARTSGGLRLRSHHHRICEDLPLTHYTRSSCCHSRWYGSVRPAGSYQSLTGLPRFLHSQCILGPYANEPFLTIIGKLTDDPETRAIDGGTTVAHFTVASTPRIRNPDTEERELLQTMDPWLAF